MPRPSRTPSTTSSTPILIIRLLPPTKNSQLSIDSHYNRTHYYLFTASSTEMKTIASTSLDHGVQPAIRSATDEIHKQVDVRNVEGAADVTPSQIRLRQALESDGRNRSRSSHHPAHAGEDSGGESDVTVKPEARARPRRAPIITGWADLNPLDPASVAAFHNWFWAKAALDASLEQQDSDDESDNLEANDKSRRASSSRRRSAQSAGRGWHIGVFRPRRLKSMRNIPPLRQVNPEEDLVIPDDADLQKPTDAPSHRLLHQTPQDWRSLLLSRAHTMALRGERKQLHSLGYQPAVPGPLGLPGREMGDSGHSLLPGQRAGTGHIFRSSDDLVPRPLPSPVWLYRPPQARQDGGQVDATHTSGPGHLVDVGDHFPPESPLLNNPFEWASSAAETRSRSNPHPFEFLFSPAPIQMQYNPYATLPELACSDLSGSGIREPRLNPIPNLFELALSKQSEFSKQLAIRKQSKFRQQSAFSKESGAIKQTGSSMQSGFNELPGYVEPSGSRVSQLGLNATPFSSTCNNPALSWLTDAPSRPSSPWSTPPTPIPHNARSDRRPDMSRIHRAASASPGLVEFEVYMSIVNSSDGVEPESDPDTCSTITTHGVEQESVSGPAATPASVSQTAVADDT